MVPGKLNGTSARKVNTYKRPKFDYEDRCDQFRLQKREFETQFFPYYNARLKNLIEPLKKNALAKWGQDVPLCPLSQLGEYEQCRPDRIAVIGILFKHLDKQPSILKEVSEDHQIFFESQTDRYTSDTDYMILQEGSEAIRLTGNVDVKNLVTGIVACVLGVENEENNSFEVDDICFSGPPRRAIERPLPTGEPKYILFVSGLGFSRNEPTKLQEARDILWGLLSGELEDPKNGQIIKLIVAGNCVGKNVRKEETELLARSGPQWSQKSKAYSVAVVKQMDEWLYKMGAIIQVDVMPGETDPSSMLLPQQAFHPAIMPNCSTLGSVRCTTNPYAAKFDGTLIMGTSGQTANTIRAYSEIDDGVQIMCRQLEWNHQAPIAPDCLHCYPYTDQDPFIFQERPHVYFVGNQPTFNTMMFEVDGSNTRLISIPDFESTYSYVLLNLTDLSCEILSAG